MNSLHLYRNNNKNRNLLSNAPYFTANVREPEYKCVNYNLHENNYLQRSFSADNVVIRSRGFKPSDIRDPAKKHFLENLTTKILHVDMEPGEAKRIDLQKLLTPASDSEELYHAKNKKMYASSYFYAPSHPTVEDQVELARRISHSLSDVKNMKSKGQSMYVNRKKRSVKWIHDGNGLESEEETESNLPIYKDKLPLKCVMNPKGKVLDIHGIQALGEDVNIEETPSHPEKLFDIVRDLNNQKGRGAEIFAKRRKRSEKWVVDKERSQAAPETPSGIPWKTPFVPNSGKNKQEIDVKENSILPPLEPLQPLPKPFYNPFTLDLSLSPGSAPNSDRGNNGCNRFSGQGVGNSNGTKTREGKNARLRSGVAESLGFHQFLKCNDRRSSSDAPRDCRLEKPRKHSSIGKRSKPVLQPVQTNDRRAVSSRCKFFGVSRGAPYGHDQAYNNGGTLFLNPAASMSSRNRGGPYVKRYNNPSERYEGYDDDEDEDEDEEEEENDEEDDEENGFGSRVDKSDDYTPVPVKELIKEFEKSCRPSMQYKRNGSGKIAAQLCALDSEAIKRYFEGRAYVSTNSVKRNGDGGRVQNEWKDARRRDQSNGTRLYREDQEQQQQQQQQQSIPDSRRCVAANNVREDPRQRGWRMKYIDGGDDDDDEDDDDDDDDDEDDDDDDEDDEDDEETPTAGDSSESSCSPNQNLASFLDENNLYYSMMREFPDRNAADLALRDAEAISDLCPQLQQTNGDDTRKPVNTPIPVENNDKSPVLAMVASGEDIVKAIKHLRRTPVLNNLIPAAASPDLCPSNGNIGSKLYENNNDYQGPKLNSYQRLSNYNTAPRGWDQGHTYYRPVTFGRPPQDAIVYSDF